MPLTDRELLRLHIEAVWWIHLPPLSQNDIEILPTDTLPSWGLYVAEIASGRIHIWRPGLTNALRVALLERLEEVLTQPVLDAATRDISQEVVLQQIAEPTIDLATARTIAQPITSEQRELLDTWEPGAAEYLLRIEHRPVFAVIIDGRVLCVAHSSRRTDAACELGIETHPDARRKGYALAATILWTAAVAQEGLIPIYSALAENTASLKLAHAAGYRVFARGAHIASIE
jgi:RimJ/RimL family protein N-acetyltransferase